MSLAELVAAIGHPDNAAITAAKARWDAIAHPLGSLGALEQAVIAMAGMQGTTQVDISHRVVVVMCSDNGVVAEGVTQTTQEVTAVVTENMAKGDTSVCRMAAVAAAQVIPVDIGVARPVVGDAILQRAIRRGTANMTQGPAMTRDETLAAIAVGYNLVAELHSKGVGLIATGEMGIGNTTTSSAVVSVLLGQSPQAVTGRGAGLTSAGLARKIDAIERAIALNKPNPADGVDVLGKVGGLDLAGLAGVFLGGARWGIPVLVDGFISSAAALAAVTICPTVRGYLLGSHTSKEPAGRMVIHALGLAPFIDADMCLGEGTGAVAAIPILDMALAVYSQMTTFESTKIDAYQPLI